MYVDKDRKRVVISMADLEPIRDDNPEEYRECCLDVVNSIRPKVRDSARSMADYLQKMHAAEYSNRTVVCGVLPVGNGEVYHLVFSGKIGGWYE